MRYRLPPTGRADGLLLEDPLLLRGLLWLADKESAGERLIRKVWKLFVRQERESDLLSFVMYQEIAETERPELILREDSSCIAIMLCSLRYHTATWLTTMLEEPLKMLLQLTEDIEIDPTRRDSSEGIEQARATLIGQCEQILLPIFATPGFTEMVFKPCNTLYQYADSKFSDASGGQRALTSLFFLRYLCPIITFPDNYKILKGPVAPDSRRRLVLVAKVIQAVANTASEGALQLPQDSYMSELSDFIIQQSRKLAQFITRARSQPGPDDVIINPKRVKQSHSFLSRQRHKQPEMGRLDSPRGSSREDMIAQFLFSPMCQRRMYEEFFPRYEAQETLFAISHWRYRVLVAEMEGESDDDMYHKLTQSQDDLCSDPRNGTWEHMIELLGRIELQNFDNLSMGIPFQMSSPAVLHRRRAITVCEPPHPRVEDSRGRTRSRANSLLKAGVSRLSSPFALQHRRAHTERTLSSSLPSVATMEDAMYSDQSLGESSDDHFSS